MNDKIKEYLDKNSIQFAHVITVAGYFSNNIVEFVHKNDTQLNSKNHVFLIEESDSTKPLEKHENVFLVKGLKRRLKEYFELLSNNVDNIVVHFLDFDVISQITDKVAKKIIWRTWGNDLTYSVSYFPTLKLKLKALYKKLYWNTKGKALVKKFKSIGISASECDRIELKRQKINTPCFCLPYPTEYWQEDFERLLKEQDESFDKPNDEIWIMVGHSANSALNHVGILKKLAPLKDQKIRIVMPMSYGRKEYAKKVESFALKNFSDKVLILKENLPYKKYVQLLSKIDFAIFDSKHQMGLGNIVDLLLLGRVVFLNQKGIVYKTLQDKKVNINSIKQLNNIDFNKLLEIKNHHQTQSGIEYAQRLRSKQFVISAWKNMMINFNK